MLFWKYIWYDIKRLWGRITLRGLELLKSGRNQQLRYEFLERWEKFTSFRKWANDHPLILAITAGISFFIFLVVLAILFWPSSSYEFKEPEKVWFYDLNTGELLSASSESVPPIDTLSGKMAGVKAHVFSSKNGDNYIGYLEKFENNVHLIKRVEDEKWVEYESSLGKSILKQTMRKLSIDTEYIYSYPED